MTFRQEPVLANFKTPREHRKRRKTPAEKRPGDPDYVKKVKKLPCCVCGAPGPSQIHHLKQGTGERGMAKRSSDKWGVPLCFEHHINGVERVASQREMVWFQSYGVEPLTLAAALFANKHSLDAMRAVLGANR